MKNPTPANPDMADTLLFEHFATLATAPDGIARLRELILQLAVQGKLGTQDAGDEPASILLEQIREENLKLINEGTRKKNKKQNFSDSIDFSLHIPKNWTNCILEDITLQITDGEHIIPPRISRGVPLLTAKNVRNGYLDLKIIDYVDPEIAKKCWKRCKPIKNDVLMVCIGSIGRLCHVENPPDVVLARSVALLRPNEKVLYPKFLETVLKSPYCQNELQLKIRQVAQPGLYLGRLCKLVIPLPPLAEQHRIVAKVDRLMALCDELEARQQQERAGCLKLGTASLAVLENADSPEEFGRQWAQVCDAFDLILDCPENVAVLRQMILQLAVLGKLGTCDKDSQWQEVKIREICRVISGFAFKSQDFVKSGVPAIKISNIGYGEFLWKQQEYLSESLLKEYEKFAVFPDTILIALTRPITQNIVKVSVYPNDAPVALLNQRVAALLPSTKILKNFLLLFIRSDCFKDQVLSGISESLQPNLSIIKLKDIRLPLPPLAEQHRIVAKVDALMALCDALEMRLKERAGVQGRLAGAVVKQVAG